MSDGLGKRAVRVEMGKGVQAGDLTRVSVGLAQYVWYSTSVIYSQSRQAGSACASCTGRSSLAQLLLMRVSLQ
jgi:hypothetical protein